MDPLVVKTVTDFDHWLFQKINGEWTSAVLDFILPFLTDLNKQRWLPFVVIAILLFWIFKQRNRALMFIFVLVLSVGASDLISYRVIKASTDRARPEQAGVPVVLRTTHHSGSSFPSNHAANAFAAASILSTAFPVATFLWFFIAFLVAYSRVYVGVHFPLDVIAGAFLGWGIAFAIRILLSKLIIRAELSESNRHERAYELAEKKRRKDMIKRNQNRDKKS